MYLQKGVGSFIRSQLRRFGINLNDQSRNQALAKLGSADGSLATVDLSSASDSICTEFVYQMVPTLWYSHLSAIRSPITIIDGDRHVNQMFSSMGNGFTFELQSLLYFALAKAVAYHTRTPGVISVYGDDIIVPSEMCPLFIHVLSFFGFSTNEDKTFYDGPFRESCGGHFNSGVDITPFYIRKPIDDLHYTITVANQLRQWSSNGSGILDPQTESAWQLLANRVPKCFWGGTDLNDSSRMVSFWKPDRPKRLQPLSDNRRNDDGTYAFWLSAKEFVVDDFFDRALPWWESYDRPKAVRYNFWDVSQPTDALSVSDISVPFELYRSKAVGWDNEVTGDVYPVELE
jgi:hypothetical protein